MLSFRWRRSVLGLTLTSLLYCGVATSLFAQAPTAPTPRDPAAPTTASPETPPPLAAGDPTLPDPNAANSSGSDPATGDPATGAPVAGDLPVETTSPDAVGDSKDSISMDWELWQPIAILTIGILIVLGLIIGLKVNAFIALITAAIAVSLMAPGDASSKISRVAKAFGDTAGGIGIVIALAAVIGKCMLDCGAADRIVRAFVRLLGEKRAPLALMGSGYILSVPVFFDTVFYLLVPLARSLHRRTRVQYLKYILAISAGGALTHSLVPPTPGPLLMASTLNVDLGMMILIGGLVALPAALVGVMFAHFADKIMKTPMRPIPGMVEPEPLSDDELPSLWMSLLPVLLPVVMISANTVLTTIANMEPTTQLARADVDWDGLRGALVVYDGPGSKPGAAKVWDSLPNSAQTSIAGSRQLSDGDKDEVISGLNGLLRDKRLYSDDDFLGVRLRKATKELLDKDTTRMEQALVEHRNRLLLEDVFNRPGSPVLTLHNWNTPKRQAADYSKLFGNANLALLISTVIALWMLIKQRGLNKREVADVVEQSLMSAGVIILITAGGGAFGGMLKAADISGSIETLFGSALDGGGSGMAFLCLGFAIAAVLKVAQGSGTVAMIVGSSMMSAIVGGETLAFSPVYLATAIGAGSLVGSWMNDSGFWIFAKMGGLTETEALKSWTMLLVVLGIVSFGVTLALATYLPLAPAI